MKNRLEIIQEVYGNREWDTRELTYIVCCIQMAQEEAQKTFEQAVTDPENQPSQYGTVTLEHMEKVVERAVRGEREACAQLCESYDKASSTVSNIGSYLGNRIRARIEK